VPLAAIVLCFAANVSKNDGVNRIFLKKELVAVFFGVFHLMFSGSLVADVRICGQKIVMAGWMMLGPVICQILCSRSPVKLILVLRFAAMQPVESHVHGLQRHGQNFVGE
jgi:hypothetical protein